MNLSILKNLFHIFFVGLLFLYIGIKKNNAPILFYKMLIIIGIFIILYHLYKVYVNLLNKKIIWVNLFHILLVAPLLIYIGMNKNTNQRFYYEIILLLGFSAIGYHSYYLFTNIFQ